MNRIDILIISTKYDFSTDYVCIELNRRKKRYLRINRDEFARYIVKFSIENSMLEININGVIYYVDESLKSVYYRAPTYFRETYLKQFSSEEQLYNSQWMAFVRNLSYFESAKWVNNPNSTYKAENKLLQLKYAKEVGLEIPSTIVSNDNLYEFQATKAIKSLDTAIFTINGNEAFFYTNIMDFKEYSMFDKSLCPLIIQENLHPKIDYRVTVVGNYVYTVKIVMNDVGINGDWRKQKENISFVPIQLPSDIEEKCLLLMRKFDLLFGGIDLILHNEKIYFIEVNPTGEWAWLVDKAEQKIYEGIADVLCS